MSDNATRDSLMASHVSHVSQVEVILPAFELRCFGQWIFAVKSHPVYPTPTIQILTWAVVE